MSTHTMHIENRGTEETPFGFVYDGDRARAYFTIINGTIEVGGSGSGYWQPFTQFEMHAAAELLRERFGWVSA